MANENIKIIYSIDTTDLDKLLVKFGKLSEEEKEQIRLLGDIDKKSQSTINNQSNNFNNMASTVKKVGVAVAAAFAFDKIKEFTNEVIKTTSTFQKFEAVLTNTLGSSSKAQKALQMIQDFASKTPFSVEQLTESFVTLANRGIVPTESQMRQLGDLASSTGKDFNQLTEALLDAMTGEFERLKEFGIKASNEGDRVKFTFKGVTTEVSNTEDSIKKYVLSLGDLKGVSGGMSAISQTLGGQISNLGDTFDQLKLAIGNRLSGAFSLAIGGLNAMISGFTNFIAPAKTAEQQVYAEQNALNLLVNQITLTNQGSSERKALMEKLNAEYPFFLKNMDKENATNEQLIGHLNKVNDLYIKKAFLMAKEKEISLVMTEMANSAQRQESAQRKLLEVSNRVNNEGQRNKLLTEEQITLIQKQSDIKIRALLIQNNLEKGLREAELKYNENFNLSVSKRNDPNILKGRVYAFQNELKIVNSAIDAYNLENENLQTGNELIKKRTDEINKQRKELGGIFDDPAEVKKQQTVITKAQYEELEKRLKQSAEFELRERIAKQKQVIELLELDKQRNEEILQNGNVSELKRIKLLTSNFEIDKQIIEAKKQNELNSFEIIENKGKLYSTYSIERKKLTKTESLNIETISGKELLKVIQSYNIEKDKLELQSIDKERQRSVERRKIKFDSEIDAQNQNNTLILLSELDSLKRSEEAFRLYNERKTELSSSTQREQINKRIEYLDIELNKLLPTELEKKKEIERQITELKKENLNLQLSEAERTAQKEIAIAQKKREEIAQIEAKAIEVGRAFSDLLFQTGTDRRNAELEQIRTQREYELQSAGDNANKKAFINAKFAEEEKKIKTAQARADRDKAIFDILINTSVAVVKALPNVFLAGLVAVLGGIQLASVISKPLPKFRKGTEYLQRGDNPNGIDTIPILANEGERIVPTEINAQLKNIKNYELPELVRLGIASKQEQNQVVNVNLENIPQTKFVFNKKGFEEYVVSSGFETKILNNNNSI